MEISTDPDGTVYVRRHPGGPYTVLSPDDSVTTEHGMGGETAWTEWEHEYRRRIPAGHAVPLSEEIAS